MQRDPFSLFQFQVMLSGQALADPNISSIFERGSDFDLRTGWVPYVRRDTSEICVFEVLGEVHVSNLFEAQLIRSNHHLVSIGQSMSSVVCKQYLE